MSHEITHDRMTITPEMAARWLEKNTHNRKLQTKNIDQYAQDMRNGDWQYTHQGICLAADGTIVDGQHRLHAIVRAGVPVEMLVTRNAPFTIQGVVDAGTVRNAEWSLRLGFGMDVGQSEVATARRIYNPFSNLKISNSELAHFFQQHEPAIRFAHSLFKERLKGVTTAQLYATVARAWYTQDRKRLVEFANVICNFTTHSDEDQAAIRLLKFLSTDNPPSKSSERYGKIQNALRAFLAREPMLKLTAANSELFPLPDRPWEKEG